MNMILMRGKYPPAIIRKRDRLQYIKYLEQAQLGGSIDAYTNLMYKAINKSLDIYINAINDKQPKIRSNSNLLKIGELAKQSNSSVPTIRHWVKIGLLEIADNTQSGYQLFSMECLNVIKEIRILQSKDYL